ncbi:hypothetical protein H3H37_17115 [Duganella sp. LX20W]|uniref:Uncharacterized protein n=1 Tax=Rugamonas brunnea TaxID=2758569 RepID=A0A7W2EUC3_9BURK|nr:hypothetical protein [Rugamonas brunnea]MBA5638781.1 hypothetical protein [Rugamonas brunnea]
MDFARGASAASLAKAGMSVLTLGLILTLPLSLAGCGGGCADGSAGNQPD